MLVEVGADVSLEVSRRCGVGGVAAEAFFAVEEESPGFAADADVPVAIAILERVEARVAVADALQADDDLRAADGGAGTEHVVDRQLRFRFELLACVRGQDEREAMRVAPP